MGPRMEMEGGGWLELREQGGYIQLSALRKQDQEGLYKIRVLGETGAYLLGTMIPEGDRLSLRRSLSQQALLDHGAWPIIGAKCELVYSFTDTAVKEIESNWRWEHHPSSLFCDPVLSEAAAAWGSMLFRTQPDGFQLAAPFDSRHPFPLSPVFCFGCVCTVDAQLHITFRFSQDGHPLLP